MMDPQRQERLDQMAKIAVGVETATGVPANLMVSQWALESKWGTRPVGTNNYFGMKHSSRHELCCSVYTHEVLTDKEIADWNRKHPDRPAKVEETMPDGRKRVGLPDEFADYRSIEESALDYAWLLSHGKPYSKAWGQYLKDKDARLLLSGIASVYATDPAYRKLVQTIAGQGDLVMAIAKARM